MVWVRAPDVFCHIAYYLSLRFITCSHLIHLDGIRTQIRSLQLRSAPYCQSFVQTWQNCQSLAGPWSTQIDIAPAATRTYFSQNTFDLLINDNLAIYMGDRWRPSLLGSSRYIWFPLTWSNGIPQIVQTDIWSINLSSGTYTAAAGVSYEAESGIISGSATILSDTSFSGGKAIGYLGLILSRTHPIFYSLSSGNGGSVTINNVQGTGTAQWVALYYANGSMFYTHLELLTNSTCYRWLDLAQYHC